MVFCLKMAIFPTFFFRAKKARKMCFMIFQNEKTPFQALKIRGSKTPNLRFFSRVNPWFWPKKGHFSIFFFFEIQARKMCFTILQKERTPFLLIKTRSAKSRKIEIFPKGLTHAFRLKMAIFPTFFFRHYREEKCVLQYSLTKKCLSYL